MYKSFEFLVEVAKFKNRAPGAGAGNDAVTDSFVRYRNIVNNFIKYDSHSEINVSADTKREVMDFIKFEAYLLLNPVSVSATSVHPHGCALRAVVGGVQSIRTSCVYTHARLPLV